MTYVLKCHGLARDPSIGPVGQYLVWYDVDAHDGLSDSEWSKDPSRAKVFADPIEALVEWKTVSKVRPLRGDGEPNRPLTAFSVEVMPLDEALKENPNYV